MWKLNDYNTKLYRNIVIVISIYRVFVCVCVCVGVCECVHSSEREREREREKRCDTAYFVHNHALLNSTEIYLDLAATKLDYF